MEAYDFDSLVLLSPDLVRDRGARDLDLLRSVFLTTFLLNGLASFHKDLK